MKLLFISPYPLKSGITSAYVQGYIQQYKQNGYDVKTEKVYFWEHKIMYSLKWLWLLRYALSPKTIFVLHQHTIPASGPMVIPYLFIMRLFNRNVIVVSHETVQTYAKHLPDYLKWVAYLYEWSVVTLSSFYVVHTRFHKEEIETLKKTSKVEIIPHPVPKVKTVEGERKVWGFYGMISQKKGIDLLLKAYQLLPPGSLPHLRVMGAAAPGENEFMARCKSSITKEHGSFISFTGFVKEEDKALLFSEVSLMIFPYRYVSQSGALTETCMYRVPYLASDIPFFKEFKESYGCGMVFSSDDTDSLKDALKQLAENPLNIRCQEFDDMEGCLSRERCAERFEKLFSTGVR